MKNYIKKSTLLIFLLSILYANFSLASTSTLASNHSPHQSPHHLYSSQTGFQGQHKYTRAVWEFREAARSKRQECMGLYMTVASDEANFAPNQNAKGIISLDFQNISIRDLLRLFANFTNKNIIISDKIIGKTNIKLQNVKWQDALNVILKANGLAEQEENSIVFIAPANDLVKHSELPQPRNAPPAFIPLKNTEAKEIVEILAKQNELTSNSNISIDKPTNRLLVNAEPSRLPAIQKTINRLDLPIKQVLIESRIVTADDKVANELGLKFSTAYSGNATQASDNINGNMNMDLPFAVNDPGHFGMAIAKLGEGVVLNMELAALESEGHVKIISSPKLITLNNQAADIESGEEIPYQEKTYSGATSVAFKKAVLSLKTTPEIISSNKLILHLQLNQDKISEIAINGVPAIQTQQIHTQVTLHSGETIVLGGIYEYTTLENEVGIPFLRSIPLLGRLFRNKRTEVTRQELLIFVTPKII